MRTVYIRILTTDTTPETEKRIKEAVRNLLTGEEITFSEFGPYWKIEGWGELNCMLYTARNPIDIQTLFADHWESDTASTGIRLPGVEFLWIGE